MDIFPVIISVAWALFLGVWVISAFGVKRTSKGMFTGFWFRFGALIILFLILRIQTVQGALASLVANKPTLIVSWIGVLFCWLGIAFAIWARVHLGKNWGMPMSVKEKPELVTSGPYMFVRHPIYTGMLLAFIGTALTLGLELLVIFFVACIYFIYSATQEEKLMIKEFPDQYPAYKQRSRMIIPFIF